ncbi:MGMT family protein [Streptomyces sp. DSM 44915]|uniref:MGMT family protein n=1 Tax=Streptomyces chisholmiae TaxID=3075540 RepID=A0ABU2JKT3_9ACTN|nr:MGMT family protein [Streptomyces sp. DSM 44915]MDT0264863.1 MGMT family protein [Streptomyces sp. DSM 44915]
MGRRIGVGPRQVGRAMSLLDADVPWWRVVHADGRPAGCHGGRAPELLRAEGTPMRGARVDPRRARQHQPDAATVRTPPRGGQTRSGSGQDPSGATEPPQPPGQDS